jgi:small subunit ribosomal protein S1
VTEQKKPQATFGDVMLGIPSGRGGEQSRPPREERRDRPPRRDRDDKKGPMVVVKRAGGVVETRTEGAPVADGAVAAAPVVPTPVVPSGPSVHDEVHEGESFAEMYEKAKDLTPSRKGLPRVGEKVKGKIFQLGAMMAFVTVGRHEAMIELDELKDDEGILRHGVGDEIEAHVVETGAKGVLLSRRLAKGAASVSLLAEARASGMPIEGLVIAVNKGGIEVAVGDIRAFCPSSQADVRPTKLEDLVGQRLAFRVTEVKDRNVVLSRRSLLEEENKAKAAEIKKTLAVGKVLKGTVVNVQAFGAFIDLGGVEGLIPVSELSHVRIGHPSEVVKPGDLVEVEIIRLEDAEPNSPDKAKRKDRITLSMRRLMEDPFTKALETVKDGMVMKGKVVRLQPFGAFVELFSGVDGLIHISAMSDRRIAHPRDVLTVGQEIEVKVEKIDPNEKRIGLRLVKDGVAVGEGVATSSSHESAPATDAAPREKKPAVARPRRGQIVTGKVTRIEQFGVFIEWEGATALVPAAETGTERGTDLKRVFPMGTEVKAEVIEINGEKVKASITAAQRTEERADLEAWKATQKPVGGGAKGFGTLADKLKSLQLK